MTAETLAHASEPFFTTKPIGAGTGLGLAMARGFAEQSGGGMWIESMQGHGTIVTLWFPVAPANAHAAVPGDGKAIVTVDRARPRLLLVDDDDMVRAVIREQLEADDYTVLCAESGAAALALLDAGEALDLIVSDLSMPGMDGLALIRAAQLRRPGLTAILLTGFADMDAAAVAVDGSMSGTFSLLRKPIDGKFLNERVAVLLERAAGRRGC
jgi:CheY-like chemotaxis protein